MDTVGPTDHRESLRRKVAEAQAALREATEVAVIKDDPLCQHLNALALSIGAHYEIYCATEETQAALGQSIRSHTDAITRGVLDLTRNTLNTMAKEVGTQLLKAALPTMQQALRFMKYRTIYWALLAMAALIVVSGMFSYAAGLNHGRYQGEVTARAIQSALATGPDAATDWALLMADNNPVPALADCRKSITTDAEGRRYCAMPVWLDQPQGPPQ
jgi:hypothetical protein